MLSAHTYDQALMSMEEQLIGDGFGLLFPKR